MISAVVVSFESAEYLGRCLDSLAPLAGEGHEVLVVDNASSDGSAAVVRRHYPFVRLLELETNLGFGAANNRGVAASRGDSLLLLNPDAWLAEGSARRLERVLTASLDTGLVAPTLRYPDGSPQFNWNPTRSVVGESIQRLRNRFEGRGWAHGPCSGLLRALGDPGWYSAACFLVRREAWLDVGGFDEDFFLYFEDVDFGIRLLEAGWRTEAVADAVVHHLQSPTQEDKVEYRRSQLYYYRKHRPRWESRFVLRRQRRAIGRTADAALRSRLTQVLVEAERALAEEG